MISGVEHEKRFITPGPQSCLFVCFVALRPKSTAMVMTGRSDHLTTLFLLGKLKQTVNQYFVRILSLVFLNNSAEGKRMVVEISS